jgi:hypothetical protein
MAATDALLEAQRLPDVNSEVHTVSVLRRMGPYSLKTFPPSFLPV